uniref:Transcriptional regulator n=1 Tax=Syphacia muris TaxID=451379 RepID=A0A0N5AU52_9BILA
MIRRADLLLGVPSNTLLKYISAEKLCESENLRQAAPSDEDIEKLRKESLASSAQSFRNDLIVLCESY